MEDKKVKLMDVPFLNTTKESFLNDRLVPDLLAKRKRFVVTANPEFMMETKVNAQFKQSLLDADYVIADGIGIIYASKMLGTPIQSRVPGFEVMQDLLGIAQTKQLSCYFLGASESTIEKTIKNVKSDYPELHIAGFHHGYIDILDEEVVKSVKNSNPDLIFVAMGFPKQEQWISTYLPLFDKGIFMGVGGSFDIIAGNAKRAPKVWQKLNLEWFYRLLKEPARWKRMIQLPLFIFEILKNKRSH
ncbi:N-acetylglucosaminyldiphosphoundecaprenol N-acetyl-beta-D-mannosaminyltransferase [Terribacillus saccharophilus]|uniref:N-acetylglucosaminyldiphosphoundecaprenol N-acetyl-beta-D-mannosaminyltransferase n=1 Tax=Terribacillus saccharophilus TaxID=361277 RepID=A0AAX2EFJ7_9BACI|nr:N-acetylglucosaminyldiphosphoundecaprenol N-acetyl-beta-D-mannosaminyltransferase [Terribacillus saccharophilus]